MTEEQYNLLPVFRNKDGTINEEVTAAFRNAIVSVKIDPNEMLKRHRTNADRIRNMTDEELAVFLDDISNGCDNCPKRRYCLFDSEEENCRDAFLKWLKEKVEHDT